MWRPERSFPIIHYCPQGNHWAPTPTASTADEKISWGNLCQVHRHRRPRILLGAARIPKDSSTSQGTPNRRLGLHVMIGGSPRSQLRSRRVWSAWESSKAGCLRKASRRARPARSRPPVAPRPSPAREPARPCLAPDAKRAPTTAWMRYLRSSRIVATAGLRGGGRRRGVRRHSTCRSRC